MPEVSRFFGIVIRLHNADHNPPHFHATYQGWTVEVDIRTLELMEGTISPRALGLALECACLHQGDLLEAWRRAAAGEPIAKISPLS
jgi:hypothetical protein